MVYDMEDGVTPAKNDNVVVVSEFAGPMRNMVEQILRQYCAP